MSAQPRGRGPVLLIVFLALLLLVSLSLYDRFFRTGNSGQNLMLAEAGRMLGRDVLPAGYLPDINRNDIPEQLFQIELPVGSNQGQLVVSAVVMELVRRKPQVVLTLGPEGIFSGGSARVIDQVLSAGYRLTLPNDTANRTLRVQLVDADGKPVSDEIGLRWDAQAKEFRVTE